MNIFDHLNQLLFNREFKDFHTFILKDRSIKFSEKIKHLNKLKNVYSKNVDQYSSNLEELQEDDRNEVFISQAELDLQLEEERLANIEIAIQRLNYLYKRAENFISTHDVKTTNTTRRPIGKPIARRSSKTSRSKKVKRKSKRKSVQKKRVSKRKSVQKKRRSKRRSLRKKRKSKKNK